MADHDKYIAQLIRLRDLLYALHIKTVRPWEMVPIHERAAAFYGDLLSFQDKLQEYTIGLGQTPVLTFKDAETHIPFQIGGNTDQECLNAVKAAYKQLLTDVQVYIAGPTFGRHIPMQDTFTGLAEMLFEQLNKLN